MDREQAIKRIKWFLDFKENENDANIKKYNDNFYYCIDEDDFKAFEMAIEVLAIPQDHDGCKDCRWQSQSETEMPCKQCMHNYTDEWEREKPTDTITMTREEFSEKLMEHYRQGRADEKAYQNGEIMQSFNPD